jgi:hypothetical protein
MAIMNLIKGLSTDEKLYLENLIDDMEDEEKQMFLIQYKVKRRNPFVFILLTLFGFLGIAGFQRFYSKDYLMGFLYLFTLGLFFIGSIFDLVSFYRITFASNLKTAEQTAFQIRDSVKKLK